MIHNSQPGNHTGAPSATYALFMRVFAWLAAAVAISGVAAYLAADIRAFSSVPMLIVLFLVQIGIVFFFANALVDTPIAIVRTLFVVYAMVTGLVLSGIFTLYAPMVIARVFFIAAGMFSFMSLYGFYTKADLSQNRSLLMMGLWGVIIALLVNIFFRSQLMDTLISIISVLLFALLTAYDIQFIKKLADYLIERGDTWDAIALRCALQLYLDLLNLFLSLLRLSGRQR